MSISQIVLDGFDTVGEIYEMVLRAMDAAEAEKESGADKKAWVMAFIESSLNDIGENWQKWMKSIIAFIDFAKSFYNQFK